jgi:integrase
MAKKRASGEGSVYQRSNGVWVAVTPPPRQYSTAATQREAIKKRDAIMAARGDAQLQAGSVAALVDAWLKRKAEDIDQASLRVYRIMAGKYIVPTIGKRQVHALTPEDVRRVWDAAATKAPNTRGLLRVVLRSMLKYGRKLKLLAHDPTEDLPIPETTGKPYTADELKRFLVAARESKYEALVLVYAFLGLRRSEALGLQWDDLDGKTIRVHRQLKRKRGEGLYIAPMKTQASMRMLVAPRGVLEALERHRTRQQAMREAAGAHWRENGLIFTNRVGEPQAPEHVLAIVRGVMRAAGLDERRTHDLRHTVATLLLSKRVPLRTVSGLLGHASPKITLTTYSHLVPGMLDEAADVMDEIAGD